MLAYGRLSKINILADKPIPAERSEGPSEQSEVEASLLEVCRRWTTPEDLEELILS